MSVWDNQQATSWFAGILEGEGSFGLQGGFQKVVSIPNTDRGIIRECQKFLVANRIAHSTYENTKKTSGCKTVQCIDIRGTACDDLFELVQGSLECRLDQFQRILGASETERETIVDLHWLIGVWEAEGGFYAYKRQKWLVNVMSSVMNLNYLIIGKVLKTLHSLDCSARMGDYMESADKPNMQVTIKGIYKVRKFLLQTQGLWRSPRNVERSSLLLEIINIELAKLIKAPYTTRQLQIFDRLKQLND